MQPEVSVVIPYFQRRPGILTQTLASVARQRQAPPTEVIIVDDGSPEPAEAELATIQPPTWLRITVIHQANAGVSAARNAGLSAASPLARVIAFLDSDDEWFPDHLRRAHAAIAGGAALYSANYMPHGSDQPILSTQDIAQVLVDDARLPQGVLRYAGDLHGAIARGQWIGHTSTYALRADLARSARFEVGLSAGEDNLYLFDAMGACGPGLIAYGTEVDSRCGEGINIWAAAAWGSPTALRQSANQVRYLRRLLQRCQSRPEAGVVRQRLAKVRGDFAAAFLHDLRRLRPGLLGSVRHALS